MFWYSILFHISIHIACLISTSLELATSSCYRNSARPADTRPATSGRRHRREEGPPLPGREQRRGPGLRREERDFLVPLDSGTDFKLGENPRFFLGGNSQTLEGPFSLISTMILLIISWVKPHLKPFAEMHNSHLSELLLLSRNTTSYHWFFEAISSILCFTHIQKHFLARK